uniref:Ribonuclease H2 subunit C n=1 Tax=Mesocestoides corti TaxID=53468 RepID=A0A5K3EIW5_MESCO
MVLPSSSIVHSIPVNLDADGINLQLPKDFISAGQLNDHAENVYTAHLRGRKLQGRTFQMPAGAEANIFLCEGGHNLDEEAGNLRFTGGSVEKLVIWDTSAPSGTYEKLQAALLWAKLNAALS